VSGGGRGIAQRKRAADLAAVNGYSPRKVLELAQGLVGQMRQVQTITPLEMIGVGDAIFMTVAQTVLEVAAPGDEREAIRKQLVEILDRMRREVETGPEGSGEVM
jgi:hypothetical protein